MEPLEGWTAVYREPRGACVRRACGRRVSVADVRVSVRLCVALGVRLTIGHCSAAVMSRWCRVTYQFYFVSYGTTAQLKPQSSAIFKTTYRT